MNKIRHNHSLNKKGGNSCVWINIFKKGWGLMIHIPQYQQKKVNTIHKTS